MKKTKLLLFLLILITCSFCYFHPAPTLLDARILNYAINPKKQSIQFFWKNEKGEIYQNFNQLKDWLHNQNQDLVFAMNGGMFKKDLSPLGLYIEKGKRLAPLDTIQKGYGNFYLQPNGIFYFTNENKAVICPTADFENNPFIKYATQSGPMLMINGQMHPAFNNGSKNLNIRNGVGILPNGDVLFAMSKAPINFYDFATFFKEQGCQNALYLDGFVSKTYLPSQDWIQTDGNFGVIIAEIEKN